MKNHSCHGSEISEGMTRWLGAVSIFCQDHLLTVPSPRQWTAMPVNIETPITFCYLPSSPSIRIEYGARMHREEENFLE